MATLADDIYRAAAEAYVEKSRDLGHFTWEDDAFEARVAVLLGRPQFIHAINAAIGTYEVARLHAAHHAEETQR